MRAGDRARVGSKTVQIIAGLKDANGDLAVKVFGDDGEYWYSSVAESSLVALSAPISEPITVTVDVGTVTISPPVDGEEFCRATWKAD